jgi:hypothetical protein
MQRCAPYTLKIAAMNGAVHMSLVALTEKTEIAAALQRLEKTLSKGATKPYLVIEIPGFGGTWGKPVQVFWHQQLELWAYLTEESAGLSYWCPFGVVSPAVAPSQTPVVQINSPLEGRNFRVRGAFARDSRGRTYFLHTGGVAGGAIPHSENQVLKPRPNTKGFVESGLWKGERTLIEWPDGSSREMYAVGQPSHETFVTALSAYVHAALQYRLLMLQEHPLTANRVARRTIFLSHSNAETDRQWCDDFVSALRAKGRDVWYDQISLVPGILAEQLAKQIAERDGFVLALSCNALNSSYVRQEIDWALTLQSGKGRPEILPVRLDDCAIPSELDQFLRVRGQGDTALSPSNAAQEIDQILRNWERNQ